MTEKHLQVKVTQKALIIVENKVLMVLEDNDWELPGGRVNEDDKNLIEAFKREIKEELSLQVEPNNVFATYLFTKPTGEESLAIVYECNLKSSIKEIKTQEGEIDDWKLMSQEELKKINNIYPTSIEAVNKFLLKNITKF